ncbi:MAG: hypothetical protein IT448_08645 [Phycisphaerales bacterium]|nr:hypothetical protein [Phycisphaerales bacterium]
MRHLRNLSILVLVLLVGFGQSLYGQVLDQIPADALVVAKVSNLRQTSDKVSKLLNTLGVAQLAGIDDPLKTLKAEGKIEAGLNESGELALVIIDPEATGVADDKSVLLLVPVSDYAAFLGNFPDAKTDGAVTNVNINGTESYVSQWGGYAAISPAGEIVQAQPQAVMNIAPNLLQQANQSDAIVYLNMEKLRVVLKPELDKARKEALQENEKLAEGDEAQRKLLPVAREGSTQAINFFEDLINQTDVVAANLLISDAGISIKSFTEFAPNSRFGQLVAGLKSASPLLVRGLPEADYLYYGGWNFDATRLMDLLVHYVQPVLDAYAQTEGADVATVVKVLGTVQQLLEACKGQSYGLLAPEGKLGQEAIMQWVVTNQGDGAAILQVVQKLVQFQSDFFKTLSPEFKGEVAYNVGVKEVQGTKFDETTVNLELTPPAIKENETPEETEARQAATSQANQLQQFMSIVYGPTGMTQYYGLLGNTLVSASGVSDAMLGKLVTAAKADTDLLVGKAHIQEVNDALLPHPIAVAYLPLDQWVRTGAVYASMFGFPAKLQLPPNLPPIGMAAATQGSALQMQVYIPVDLLQNLVAAGMQASGMAGDDGQPEAQPDDQQPETQQPETQQPDVQ